MSTLSTRRPLVAARRRRTGVYAAIVGGGTIAASLLAVLAFAMVNGAWTF